MRPLRLEMSGFMPFREKQSLEFADLTLFAICGLTGSGKSTILDAMVYGLYGQTPRLGKRGMAELINPNSDKLSVVFDFEVRENIYRVVRILTKRKSGLELRLYQQDENAAWKQVSEIGTKEVNYKLTELVGLDYEDFIRAVLLPQGAFDNFLRGQSKQRLELLIKLLDLERIPRIMQLANEKSKAAKSKCDFIEKELKHFQFINSEILAGLQTEKATLKSLEVSLKEQLVEQNKVLVELEVLKQFFDEKSLLEKQKAKLEEQNSFVEERRAKLQLAQKAAPLAKPLTDFIDVQQQLSKVVKKLAKLIPKLKQQKEVADLADEDLLAIKQKRDKRLPEIDSQLESIASVNSELKQLKALGGKLTLAEQAIPSITYSPEKWQEYQKRLGQLEKLTNARANLASLKKTTTKNLKALAKNLEKNLTTLEKVAQARLQQAQKDVDKSQQALKTIQEASQETSQKIVELESLLAKLTEQGKDLRQVSEEAEQAYEAAEQTNRALVLRQHLHNGDICPVCEQVITSLPTSQIEADLKALNKARNKAKKTLDETIDEYKEINSQNKVLINKLSELKEQIKTATAELSLAEQAYTTLKQDVELEQKEAKQKVTEELQAAETEANEQLHEAEQAVSKAEEFFADFDTLVEQDLQTELFKRGELLLADLALLISNKTAGLDPEKTAAKLKKEKKALEKSLEAAREHLDESSSTLNKLEQEHLLLNSQQESLQNSLAKEQALLQQLLQQAGLANYEQVQESLLTDNEQKDLQIELESFDNAMRDFATKELELTTKIADRNFDQEHYHNLTAEKQAVELKREQTIKRLGSIDNELKETESKLQHKLELEKDLEKQQEDYGIYRQLGQDLHGGHFQKYLVRRVQEKLSYRASTILRETSQGRYDLYFQKDEYFVSDAWHSGEMRSVKNLSGGEIFMASLALALALSETIASNTVLGALFLDEGFGTLDSESLDIVAGVLENLSSQGRMVGIISHVNELTERVPDRLRVIKSNQGSVLEWDV